jgi:hypothetical protein
LIISLIATFALAYTAHILNNPLGYILAFVNGCLLFLSAAGIQQAGKAEFRGTEGAKRHGRGRVTWFTPWIRVRGAPTSS